MAQLALTHSHSKCPTGCSDTVVRRGSFLRQSDQAKIQRYLCKGCHHSFSEATLNPCFAQKKRQLNPILFKLLVGGFSQRRAAMDLGINRKTVVRKFIWLGTLAQHLLPILNQQENLVSVMEFDDLETSEHTKCKPLSVTLAVEHGSRRILGFEVAQMPAKGKLARISRLKYGFRKDERPQARKKLFETIQPLLTKSAIIKSDQNPHYGPDVKEYFQGSTHQTFKGRRGCIAGQGELKKIGFDPLFSLNHTCAMLRANINRLYRRTWCISKRKDRLALHIALYALNHNMVLIHNKAA